MRPLLPRTRLLHGASLMCVALLGGVEARAQSFGSQLALPSLPANAIPKPGVTPNLGSVSLVRDPASAAARQAAVQQRLANTLGLVSQVQAAARTAGAAMASSVPNGLVRGGLMPAGNLVSVAQDPGGLHTLQGALAPVQSGSAAAPTVTVTQTDSRAIVTWDTFNVGRDTTLVFDQKVGGVAQKDWVIFNRVVGQIDPATGRRDPNLAPAPSQILGHLQADATVIVVNPNGVFFGPNSQVRAGSLLVSTLDFGNQQVRAGVASTAGDRNASFLLNGTLIGLSPAGVAVPNPFQPGTFQIVSETAVEGDIRVSAGADLAVGDSGTLLLAAPHVTNAGSLTALNGSVLIAGGRRVSLGISTGAAGTGGDPDIRGLYIVTADLPSGVADVGAYILNTGIISSPRGYIGLRSDTGAILQQGVLSSTTSVSRKRLHRSGRARRPARAGFDDRDLARHRWRDDPASPRFGRGVQDVARAPQRWWRRVAACGDCSQCARLCTGRARGGGGHGSGHARVRGQRCHDRRRRCEGRARPRHAQPDRHQPRQAQRIARYAQLPRSLPQRGHHLRRSPSLGRARRWCRVGRLAADRSGKAITSRSASPRPSCSPGAAASPSPRRRTRSSRRGPRSM